MTTAKTPATKPAAAKNSAAKNSSEQSPEEKAIAPIQEALGDNPTPEAQARVDRTLASANVTPQPEMVNGKSVVGKKLVGDEYVDDPDYVSAKGATRTKDIFDRIGEAFMHESQRLVIEEIARMAGATEDTTTPDEAVPTVKSTASLRTDATGFGAFTGGGTVKPVPEAKDEDEA